MPHAATRLCLSALAVLVPLSAQADPKAGREIAKERCQTCHGLDGMAKLIEAPHLSGESTIYLTMQLKAFRAGTRQNEMMNVVAADLTDEQIADVSDWYNSIKVTATIPE